MPKKLIAEKQHQQIQILIKEYNMQTQQYSVYDSKVGQYLPPWQARSNGEAIRSFIDATNDPKSPFNNHPEDYTLFHIGYFDAKTAQYVNNKTPDSLGKALEFMSSTEQIEILEQQK